MIGKSIKNEDSLIMKKWSSIKPYHTGLDILATTVYSICKGVVLFVGKDEDNKYVVSVQVNNTQCVRYGNLKEVSVIAGQLVDAHVIGTADQHVHFEYCTTDLSGSIWPVRLGKVTYYKHNPYSVISGEISLDSTSAYSTLSSQTNASDMIDTSKITPYIAAVDSSVTSLNISALKSAEVVGLMVECGALYDVVHMKRPQYVNPNLKTQISIADEANLPYGLIATVRARSEDEAREECNALRPVLLKYKPKLGLWLRLQLSTYTSINNRILQKYYDMIEDAGLVGWCGLYVSRTQLNQVDWQSFQSKFYLWLIDHIDTFTEIEDIVTPQMFKL